MADFAARSVVAGAFTSSPTEAEGTEVEAFDPSFGSIREGTGSRLSDLCTPVSASGPIGAVASVAEGMRVDEASLTRVGVGRGIGVGIGDFDLDFVPSA
jgi:hypothetical protein